MILRSISLENFGLYAGRQTIDLVPRREPGRERPVVLVGGKNGAGKTTLLESVRLALYGRRALGFRVAQSEYEEHLRKRVHVGVDGANPGMASVGLEFDYAESGRIHRYQVNRRWTVRGAKVVETLTLEKDGQPVTSVPRDEWHSFLQELIPPGVSQLFFFDGEKIAEIAHDGPDEGLAEAVRGLLGIELVGRLRTDLGLFLARRGKHVEGSLSTALESSVREIGALEREIAAMAEEVAELTSKQASHARVAYNARQRFVAEGGDAANQRATLEASRDEIRRQIARRDVELKELAGGLLPFAVAPKLIERFARALGAAADPVEARDADALRERLLAWRASDKPARMAAWKEAHWEDVEAFIESDILNAHAAAPTPVAGLEVGERRSLMIRLAEVRENAAPKATLLVSELTSLTHGLKEVEANITRASGHAAGVVLEELLLAEQQVGAAEAQLKARSEELRALEYRKSSVVREHERTLRAQVEATNAKGQAELATRVGRALQQYEERLLDLKLAQLQAEFVERFNHLARKGGFVAAVRIDRSTFDTTLVDRAGREIPKSGLSAGEKQVYAIAMLWALARTSGRALPMIVDTPLARLDSDHRNALVERYFPEASHQVIVLSTDTEVDEALLARLAPNISHTYRLDYDPAKRATVVRNGYFADEEGEGSDALQQA
jgi:DNA sulfur modification protein DndD